MSFASRTGKRDRLQIFTTNYDRYIEAGSELAGLYLGGIGLVLRNNRKVPDF